MENLVPAFSFMAGCGVGALAVFVCVVPLCVVVYFLLQRNFALGYSVVGQNYMFVHDRLIAVLHQMADNGVPPNFGGGGDDSGDDEGGKGGIRR